MGSFICPINVLHLKVHNEYLLDLVLGVYTKTVEQNLIFVCNDKEECI
jgi:hypothetical protein